MEECYRAYISAPDTVSVRKGEGKIVELKIANEGLARNTFAMLDDSTWVYVRPETVSVAGQSEDITYMYVSPSQKVEAGRHNITIKAQGQNVVAQKDLVVEITEGGGIAAAGSGFTAGLASMPVTNLWEEGLTLGTLTYMLAGLGVVIVILLVALIIWTPQP